jgi:TIR domain
MAKYDLAISFAGEQRSLAESLAIRLDASGYSIFYDAFERAELWGRDLSLSLGSVYSEEARFCLVLLSKEYVEKPWTNLERQNAISRFMHDKKDYMLCLKLDDEHLPGLPDVIGYVDYRTTGEEAVYKLLLQKLGQPNHDDCISHLSPSDQAIASRILKACYRRAVFTKMASEIELEAMRRSLGDALGNIQLLIPDIDDQALQYVAQQVWAALDEIERILASSRADISNHLRPDVASKIDQQKLKIVRHLLEIRRAAKIPMQMPFTLQMDHLFGKEAADSPPLPTRTA